MEDAPQEDGLRDFYHLEVAPYIISSKVPKAERTQLSRKKTSSF
jgi:hypothetical protein